MTCGDDEEVRVYSDLSGVADGDVEEFSVSSSGVSAVASYCKADGSPSIALGMDDNTVQAFSTEVGEFKKLVGEKVYLVVFLVKGRHQCFTGFVTENSNYKLNYGGLIFSLRVHTGQFHFIFIQFHFIVPYISYRLHTFFCIDIMY